LHMCVVACKLVTGLACTYRRTLSAQGTVDVRF
jgi:hypothetical protein